MLHLTYHPQGIASDSTAPIRSKDWRECFDLSWDPEDVANFPTLDYSVRDVRRAGEALKETIPWDTPEQREEALRIFAIANSWRDSHAYPMRRVRDELGGHLQKVRLRQSGITVARLKRMQSIRKKLRIRPENITQIQDLAGCRVIVPQMDDVRKIIDFNAANSSHTLFKDYDYIAKPKKDGYRCFHRVYKFKPSDDDESSYEGRRVEIQIRTRLQHSWATAVEAVGLFRGEDFKGGAGDPNWRRLFELMSSEFAMAESCPELEGAPIQKDRWAEIKEIDVRLGAADVLENLSQAFNYTEMYVYERAKYFLIEYDKSAGSVSVKPFSNSIGGTESLDNIEAEIRTGKSINAVLVEADKIDSLKEAYPNYFGDVQVFKANLRRITRGKDAVEYKLPPQQALPPPPKEVADTAWFRRPKFRPPRGS